MYLSKWLNRSTNTKKVSTKLLKFLRTKKEDFWIKQGEKMALSTFHLAAKQVPAYKDFLQKNGVRAEAIKTIEDFKQLPIIDKENYISQYSLDELCWEGKIGGGSIISTSSGTTGEPYFWPRYNKQEEVTALLHSLIFRSYFDSDNKSTLYVVCFYLGSHIAGMITANAIKRVLDLEGKGALITPGLNKKDITNALLKLGPNFEQVVLVGYPPFLKDVVMEGKDRGIDWERLNVKFIFSAESFPESWRKYLHSLIGKKGNDLISINIYGSADLGFMANETPFTIRLRSTVKLEEILGLQSENNLTPAIFQYHPWSKYFEGVNNELICTADSGKPLIRYNIKDAGSVVNLEDLKNNLLNRGLLTKKDWQLPLVLLFGRSNHSITFYGLNIYPEHIREALTKEDVISLLSGKFFMKTIYNNRQNQQFEIHVELKSSSEKEDYLKNKIIDVIVNTLRKINLEYDKLYSIIGKRAQPNISLYRKDSPEFVGLKAKHKYIIDKKN